MKTKKNKLYSFIHVNERLFERYNLDISSKEFDTLSELISTHKNTLIDVDSNNQEIHKLLFKNKIVVFVFDPVRNYITTVLKEWNKK